MSKPTLFQQLSETVGAANSKVIPKIFEMMINEEEARVLLAASPPATVEELSQQTGISSKTVAGMMDPLFLKGLIFKSSKGGKYYRVRMLLQFHDATILWPDAPDEFFALWREYHHTEFLDDHRKIESIIPRSVVRVIPVNKTVEAETQVAAFEDVNEIVNKADLLAVTKCTCRVVDGSCGLPLDVCIQVNKAAEYALDRGTGRELTKKEALEILIMCGEKGLVHTVGNSRGLGHIICNCCKDCCINWPGPRNSNVNFASPSRFTAKVDVDLCTVCEDCLERCYFDAITMEGEGDTALIKEDACMGCGLCAVTCPGEAISLIEIRSSDFVPVE